MEERCLLSGGGKRLSLRWVERMLYLKVGTALKVGEGEGCPGSGLGEGSIEMGVEEGCP